MSIAFERIPEEFVQKARIYDYKTPLTEVLEKVMSEGAVIVTKDRQYYGLVDGRAIARDLSTKMQKGMSVGKLAKKVPILDKGTSIEKAVLYFYNSATKALPYGDSETVIGIVKREEILKALLSLHMLSDFKTLDAMTSPILGIDANANVAQAKSLMQQNKIHRLVVISNGRVAGLLTYKSIMKLTSNPAERAPEMKSTFYALSNTPVSSIATMDIYSIEQNRPLEEAVRTLIEKNISSLVVTRGGKPVGIVTVRDIFERAISGSAVSLNNIIISGLDSSTKEYEDEIRGELNRLAEKINKFTKVKTSYIALNVKHMKVRNYELRGRIVLSKKGAISALATGYSLESTLNDLIGKLYKAAKERKELIIKTRVRAAYVE